MSFAPMVNLPISLVRSTSPVQEFWILVLQIPCSVQYDSFQRTIKDFFIKRTFLLLMKDSNHWLVHENQCIVRFLTQVKRIALIADHPTNQKASFVSSQTAQRRKSSAHARLFIQSEFYMLNRGVERLYFKFQIRFELKTKYKYFSSNPTFCLTFFAFETPEKPRIDLRKASFPDHRSLCTNPRNTKHSIFIR